MLNQKTKKCWYCLQPFSYERKTARYCSDLCRVKDHKICQQEIDLAVLLLKDQQKYERLLKTMPDYDEQQ